MLKLLKYLRPYTFYLIVLVFLVAGQVAANLALPDYMGKIINQGIVANDTHTVVTLGLEMLLISFLGGIAAIGAGYCASITGVGFARDLRTKIFTKVENFSLAEFNTFSTASLITRSTNDIQQIQTVLVIVLRLLLLAPLTGAGAILKAYQTAPSMTWIMALAVIVLLSIIITLFSIAIPKFQLLQKLVDRLNLVTREILTGLRVIRAFNTEKIEEKKFARANDELTATNLFTNRLMVIMQPAMMLIMNFTALAIIWFGAHAIDAGSLQIGNMLAFMQYSAQVIFAFLMISFIFIMVPRASVSAGRVSEVLATKEYIKDPENPHVFLPKDASVEFENVSFSYPSGEEPVLKHISFTAEAGQTTAIIGSTGCGKSTLVDLIPRFYDVNEGAVKIGGVDIRTVTQKDLRSKIGYVPQKGMLFSGTVTENISYGEVTISQREVEHAAVVAQAASFIEALDGKYDALIAQGGTNVSGGQKQRLAIARALARKPDIYIFDDSFSALDFKTDAALRQALAKETVNKTVIIVAQRISTIMDADKIIVISEGKIVDQGTHLELLNQSEVYREIATSQLSEKELERSGAIGEKEKHE